MRRKIFIFLATFLAFSFQLSLAASQTLTVKIHNIKSSPQGVIRIALFGDEKGFRAEKYLFDMSFDKSRVKSGKLTVNIPVECGVYGVTLFLMMKITTERWITTCLESLKRFRFSNFVLKKLRKPRFKDFSFTVSGKENKI